MATPIVCCGGKATFRYGLGGEHAFWNGADEEKAWSSNTDPMQKRIPSFDDVLWHLKTFRDRDVVQY